MNNIMIKDLSKSFGDKQVLMNFSDSFPLGGTTVIMGESGCGKTTLINIIMGLEKADKGEISGVPKKISAVFQEDCLCEEFTAFSNIRAVTGKRLSKKEIGAVLNKLGLSDADISGPVQELSGGMKRRVAIARAILADSELIIMDEPFKGLDDDTRRITADFVLEETKSRTLIIITHSSDEIGLLHADKVVLMDSAK